MCSKPIIVSEHGRKIKIMLKIYYVIFWKTYHSIYESLIFPSFLFLPYFSSSSHPQTIQTFVVVI